MVGRSLTSRNLTVLALLCLYNIKVFTLEVGCSLHYIALYMYHFMLIMWGLCFVLLETFYSLCNFLRGTY